MLVQSINGNGYVFNWNRIFKPERQKKITRKRNMATKSKKLSVLICEAGSADRVVEMAVNENGRFRVETNKERCDIAWLRCSSDILSSEWRTNQAISRIPQSRDWFHKKTLHRTTRVFSLLFPGSFFHFCPSTWDFPEERQELLEEARTRNTCYILKPNGGSQGEGISLFYASRANISQRISRVLPSARSDRSYVIQEYVGNPFLIDDFKSDFRLYVLVTNWFPLRAYLHREGLVRLGTEKYEKPTESNIRNVYKHLTNSSLNQYNDSNYELPECAGENSGSKRALSTVIDHYFTDNWSVIWENIKSTLFLACLATQPLVATHTQSMGSGPLLFQLLGFDVMLDDSFTPILIEVNGSPSLKITSGTERDRNHPISEIDVAIKQSVIADTLNLIGDLLMWRSRDAQDPDICISEIGAFEALHETPNSPHLSMHHTMSPNISTLVERFTHRITMFFMCLTGSRDRTRLTSSQFTRAMRAICNESETLIQHMASHLEERSKELAVEEETKDESFDESIKSSPNGKNQSTCGATKPFELSDLSSHSIELLFAKIVPRGRFYSAPGSNGIDSSPLRSRSMDILDFVLALQCISLTIASIAIGAHITCSRAIPKRKTSLLTESPKLSLRKSARKSASVAPGNPEVCQSETQDSKSFPQDVIEPVSSNERKDNMNDTILPMCLVSLRQKQWIWSKVKSFACSADGISVVFDFLNEKLPT